MNTEKQPRIAKYRYNKWLDKWVAYNNGKKFEWLISVKVPFIRYKMDLNQSKEILNSGLSTSSKAVAFFLMLNRFGDTPVCLYGNGYMAKRIGMSKNTIHKALDELIKASVIAKAKIYTGKNISYQYYFLPKEDWKLPINKFYSPECDNLPDNFVGPIAIMD